MKETIRQAEAKDVPALFDMWKALIKHEQGTWPEGASYPQLDMTDQTHVMPFFEALTEHLMADNSRVWVAEVDGQPAGYAVAYHYERRQGEPKVLIHVEQMYVKPTYRRAARVARLFELVIEGWAESVQADVIECSATATDAQIKRWTKKGFTPYQVTLYRQARWKGKT